MPLWIWNTKGGCDMLKNRDDNVTIILFFPGRGRKVTFQVKPGTMQPILDKRNKVQPWKTLIPTPRAVCKILAQSLQLTCNYRILQASTERNHATFNGLRVITTISAALCLGCCYWVAWLQWAWCLHGGGKMKTVVLFQPLALWIGAHYSPQYRRWCINLLPCVTLCIVGQGGTLPSKGTQCKP